MFITNKSKIVGICLIKNEDLYIEAVLNNIIDFCDEIIVLDNMSEDNTFKIVESFAKKSNKIKLIKIKDIVSSHKFIEKYADTDTWIFSIDGDEIYDPVGLKRMKEEILSGKYQNKWLVHGNSLNCEEIDLNSKKAKGYLSPPSKLEAKIFNFSLLESWTEKYTERLHGTNSVFKKGYNKSLIYKISDDYNWDDSYFRNLHICFVKRTSLDNKYKNLTRLTPQENSHPFAGVINFILNLKRGKITLASAYKIRKYKEGELITKNIQLFFPR